MPPPPTPPTHPPTHTNTHTHWRAGIKEWSRSLISLFSVFMAANYFLQIVFLLLLCFFFFSPLIFSVAWLAKICSTLAQLKKPNVDIIWGVNVKLHLLPEPLLTLCSQATITRCPNITWGCCFWFLRASRLTLTPTRHEQDPASHQPSNNADGCWLKLTFCIKS